MFDECTYDSLRDWGVDPDMDEKITKPLGLPIRRGGSVRTIIRATWSCVEKSRKVRARLLLDTAGQGDELQQS